MVNQKYYSANCILERQVDWSKLTLAETLVDIGYIQSTTPLISSLKEDSIDDFSAPFIGDKATEFQAHAQSAFGGMSFKSKDKEDTENDCIQ